MIQAYRAFKNCVGTVAQRFGLFGERVTVTEIGAGPEGAVDEFEFDVVTLCDKLEDFDSLCHDFRADAVSV
jgi:hypothetical protein